MFLINSNKLNLIVFITTHQIFVLIKNEYYKIYHTFLKHLENF